MIEARALHADCILLIVACLSDQQLEEMSKTAFEQNLDVLVEVHDEAELERALRLPERCILGVNNRNLKTFDVDLNTSIRLKKLLEPSRLLVTESGIATPADVAMMQEHDIHAFLVGESFMKQPVQITPLLSYLEHLNHFNRIFRVRHALALNTL